MYKLKDDVNLRELKNCGFKRKKHYYYRKYGAYFEIDIFLKNNNSIGLYNYVDGGIGTFDKDVVKQFIGDLIYLNLVEEVNKND